MNYLSNFFFSFHSLSTHTYNTLPLQILIQCLMQEEGEEEKEEEEEEEEEEK